MSKRQKEYRRLRREAYEQMQKDRIEEAKRQEELHERERQTAARLLRKERGEAADQ
jgi:hypothetical protein